MLKRVGKYLLFMYSLIRKRETFMTYVRRTLDEAVLLGINSLVLVTIISTFIGAVTTVQTANNLVSPFVPDFIISTVVRDMTVLELAPTITCIVLAGKVGSNIAGGLGTMRITEQIDALEVMGINASSYLVLPKVIATMLMFPMLVILAGFLSIYGGYIVGTLTGVITPEDYIYGIRLDFRVFNVIFALIKSVVFAFLISSISAYQGFYTKGGALEVGIASTQAVTNSCIAVLLADYVLAQLLFS
jgi:phospholipid/cholesterol/gamma-HCH transport system permease protein